MKQSTERILTTHVGSLARSDSLTPLLRLREEGQPYDRDELARHVSEAVTDVVRKQVEAGIDIVTDGEQGKSGFFSYIIERFNGFERKPAAPGTVRPRGPSVSPNRLAVEAGGGVTALILAPDRSAIEVTRRSRRILPTSRRQLKA